MTKKSTKSKESVVEVFPDFINERIEQLKTLFPEVVSEGKVDFEKLRQSLGEIVDDRPDRYSFTWAGKKNAIRLLQTPSRATLVPVPEESVNFDATQNLFIEGDNLEVLKLLYKSYARRVKMIYIDPPYNTGNDFVYRDNFTDPLDTYLEITGQKDSNGNHLSSNTETNGRYHSAWLNMMYPRLFVARQLLREDGVIFVSIDDKEVHNLRILMNEIFGEENLIEEIVWKNKYGSGALTKGFANVHEYILCYGKTQFHNIQAPLDEEAKNRYKNRDSKYPIRGGFVTQPLATTSKDDRPNLRYPIEYKGHKIWPEKQWIWSKDRFEQALANDEVIINKKDDKFSVRVKQYLKDEKGNIRKGKPVSIMNGPFNQEGTKEIRSLFGNRVFEFPKPSALVQYLYSFVINEESEKDGIYLDFFAGSCPAAQAILQLNREDGGNRHFIMVQLPEPTKDKSPAKQGGFDTITDIGKERIRRVIDRMHEEKNGELPLNGPEDLGFKVFKLAESNFRQWTGVEEKDINLYIQTMELFIDPLLPDWKPENVRYEVARQEGYSLNATIEKLPSITPNTIHRVTDAEKDQFFYISLDPKFDLQTVKALELEQGLKRDDLLIVRDVALTASLANNILQYCRLKTI